MSIKFFIFICLFFVHFNSLFCQAQNTKSIDAAHRYSPSELKQDLHQLHQALQEVHPALYRFISKHQLDSLFDATEQLIIQPLTADELKKMTVPLVTAVRCGHTEVDFSPALENPEATFFPLEITYIDYKLYVLRNHSNDSTIVVGDEIKSINGVSVDSITSVLLPIFGVDSYIKTTHKHIMHLLFKETYALYFGSADYFEINLTTRNKKNKSVILKALNKEQIKSNKAERYPSKAVVPFALSIDKSKRAAVLRVSSFLNTNVMNERYNLLRFLDSVFLVLKKQKTEHLILDVRNNAGGTGEHAQYLYSYLAHESFRMADSIHTKLNHAPSYAPQSQVGTAFNELPSGDYAYRPYGFTQIMKPQKNVFRGNLYVLMNGLTLSSGSSICHSIKAHQRGIFIGEECGSDSHQSSGLPTRLQLQYTGNVIWIAFQTYYKNGGAFDDYIDGRGVIPDYSEVSSMEDILRGKDRELDKALEIISQK